MIFTDYKEIEKIEFIHPEFMSADAEQKAINLFNEIERTRDEIYSLREELDKMEASLALKEKAWENLENQMIVTFKTIEKDYKINKTNIGFNMSAEINKNLK